MCFLCGKLGHKKFDCPQNTGVRPKIRWCSSCKNSSQDTKFCRKNRAAKSVKTASRDISYLFKISFEDDCAENDACIKILAASGATA